MHHKIKRKWVQNLSCHCYLMKILTFCFAKTLKDLLIKNFHFLLMISHFMSQYRIPPHFITITSAKKKNFQIPTWNKNKNIVGVEWHHFYHLIYDKSPKKSYIHFFTYFQKNFVFVFKKKTVETPSTAKYFYLVIIKAWRPLKWSLK
jgi:hypothetical protein